MAAVSGHSAKVYTSANGSEWTEATGVESVDCDRGLEKLDTGALGEATASKIAGRSQMSGTISFHYNQSDTAQAAIEAAAIGAGLIYLKILPDGTNGYSASCFVGPVKYNAAPGSPAKMSVPYDAAGTITTV